MVFTAATPASCINYTYSYITATGTGTTATGTTATGTGNGTAMDEDGWSTLADARTVATSALIYLLSLPFVFYVVRPFPVGSTLSAGIGAVLMVCFGVITEQEAYDVIGHREHVGTLCLIASVLLIGQYVDRERVFVKLFRHSLDGDLGFVGYALRVFVVTALASAVLTSDVACLLIAPVVMRIWKHQERPEDELECLLLGMVVSANVGGALSIFGSTQSAFIALKTTHPMYSGSYFGLLQCWVFTGIPAIVAFLLNFACIAMLHKFKTRYKEKNKRLSEESHTEQELAGLTARKLNVNGLRGHQQNGSLINDNGGFQYEGLHSDGSENRSVPCQLETIHEDEVLEITSSIRTISFRDDEPALSDDGSPNNSSDEDSDSPERKVESNLTRSSPQMLTEQLDRLDDSLDVVYTPNGLQSSVSMSIRGADSEAQLLKSALHIHTYRLSPGTDWVYRTVTGISPLGFISQCDPDDTGEEDSTFRSSDHRMFHALLLFAVLALFALALITSAVSYVHLDLGLLGVLCIMVVLISDIIFTKQSPNVVLRRVDWSALLLISAVFILTAGAAKTRLLPHVCNQLNLHHITHTAMSVDNAAAIATLTVMIIVMCNVTHPLPTAVLFMDLLVPCVGGQRLFVALVAWVGALAPCVTPFGCSANICVFQGASRVLSYRISYWRFFAYGLGYVIVAVVVTVPLVVGFLHIDI